MRHGLRIWYLTNLAFLAFNYNIISGVLGFWGFGVLGFWEWAFEAHYKHKEKKFTNIRILPLIPLPSNVLLLETERKEINKT